mmetsp:Transcript_2772/g.11512  ORF Transcript_2772/g.11512 Transcript_2772/m.11512 type:complete len:378 (+) Transcript_2772:649-1782(+)
MPDGAVRDERRRRVREVVAVPRRHLADAREIKLVDDVIHHERHRREGHEQWHASREAHRDEKHVQDLAVPGGEVEVQPLERGVQLVLGHGAGHREPPLDAVGDEPNQRPEPRAERRRDDGEEKRRADVGVPVRVGVLDIALKQHTLRQRALEVRLEAGERALDDQQVDGRVEELRQEELHHQRTLLAAVAVVALVLHQEHQQGVQHHVQHQDDALARAARDDLQREPVHVRLAVARLAVHGGGVDVLQAVTRVAERVERAARRTPPVERRHGVLLLRRAELGVRLVHHGRGVRRAGSARVSLQQSPRRGGRRRVRRRGVGREVLLEARLVNLAQPRVLQRERVGAVRALGAAPLLVVLRRGFVLQRRDAGDGDESHR